ncbi:MAG: hypothetical protein HYY67_00210 [Thaumarchaeota archaeon]|nr:hypothetical protein [Nitrososphaerota archaeon]
MGKLVDTFGKETGIRRSDIERLIENAVEESVDLEYKSFEHVKDLASEVVENLLVKPLLAFLNRIEKKSSLLVLGMRTEGYIPDRVMPVARTLIDGDKLRQKITSSIASIPTLKSFPGLKIIQVEYPENEAVYLVEINPYEDVFYYSRLTDLSYIRRANESQRLAIEEVYMLIQSKRTPRLAVVFTETTREKIDNGGRSKIRYHLTCMNGGLKPASTVLGFLKLNVTKGEPANVAVSSNLTDISHVNPLNFKTFRFTFGYGEETLVYPGVRHEVGWIEVIFPAKVEVSVTVDMFDSEGRGTQELTLNDIDGMKEISIVHAPFGP